MKVLAIDDQQLVLLPLKKQLTALGYEVKIETNAVKGLEIYDSFCPDLVIIDINMPNVSGLDVIAQMKTNSKHQARIMVLSGNTSDDIILKGFSLGIDDYMKKPLSLNEICARVSKLIGPVVEAKQQPLSEILIKKRCIGVVIPCYNEERRLKSEAFENFLAQNSGYHFCFVNDGSSDNTLTILKELQSGKEDFITVYNCEKNGGKAEAVRQGMLHMAKHDGLDFIGFLDADLSTDLRNFDELVSTISNNPKFKVVSGSRITRMGANITKESARKLISFTINFIINRILGMQFKDTQCGAKIFRKDIVEIAFSKSFVTRWLFDVEIFKRMVAHFGLAKTKTMICEQPLKRWVHVDDSKLSYKDSIKIIFQLVQIAWLYRIKKKQFKTSEEVNVLQIV